jgi:hypothetical protein
VGRTPAGSRARPNSHLPLPHGPAEKTRPSRTSVAQLARPRPRSVKRSQSRGNRSHHAAPGSARPANPDPNLAGVHSCLPRTPPQCPVSFLRTATTKSKREKLSPMKPIVGFSPNPQQTRHESSIQLEGISRMMPRPCWTLWPTNTSTRAPPRTLFPITTPVNKPSHRRRANSKLATPSQAPKEVARAAPLLQELIPEPERPQRTPPLPLKTARAASTLAAFLRLSQPL